MLGRRFGKLVVKEKIREYPHAKKDGIYRCLCDCGAVCEARGTNLRRGDKKSCGCLNAHVSPWVGRKVGQLLVLERLPGKKYRCLCDCGSEVISTSMWSRAKTLDANCGGVAHRKVAPQKPVRVPMKDHPLRSVWLGMVGRCHKPNHSSYHNYGARGVQVFDGWLRDFWMFAAYMDLEVGPRPSAKHSMDRIDNAAGYVPGNVRWALPLVQARNTRNCRPMRYNGNDYSAVAAAYDQWVCDGRPPCWEFTPGSMVQQLDRQVRIGAHEKCVTAKAVARAERCDRHRAQVVQRLSARTSLARQALEYMVYTRRSYITQHDEEALVWLCEALGEEPLRYNQLRVFGRLRTAAKLMLEVLYVIEHGTYAVEVGLLPGFEYTNPYLS